MAPNVFIFMIFGNAKLQNTHITEKKLKKYKKKVLLTKLYQQMYKCIFAYLKSHFKIQFSF